MVDEFKLLFFSRVCFCAISISQQDADAPWDSKGRPLGLGKPNLAKK